MRELPIEFEGKGEVRGYHFKQKKANEYAYIYERTNQWGDVSYEVFHRKENTQYDVISYPSSKSFGIWAWQCLTYPKAEVVFNKITLRKENEQD